MFLFLMLIPVGLAVWSSYLLYRAIDKHDRIMWWGFVPIVAIFLWLFFTRLEMCDELAFLACSIYAFLYPATTLVSLLIMRSVAYSRDSKLILTSDTSPPAVQPLAKTWLIIIWLLQGLYLVGIIIQLTRNLSAPSLLTGLIMLGLMMLGDGMIISHNRGTGKLPLSVGVSLALLPLVLFALALISMVPFLLVTFNN